MIPCWWVDNHPNEIRHPDPVTVGAVEEYTLIPLADDVAATLIGPMQSSIYTHAGYPKYKSYQIDGVFQVPS